jgi:hypothetical protein
MKVSKRATTNLRFAVLRLSRLVPGAESVRNGSQQLAGEEEGYFYFASYFIVSAARDHRRLRL